jgi:hypothetical protein
MAHTLDGSLAFALKQLHTLLDTASSSGLCLDPPTLDMGSPKYSRSGLNSPHGSDIDTSSSDPSEGSSTDEEPITDPQVIDGSLNGSGGGSASDISDAHLYVNHELQADELDDMESWRRMVAGESFQFIG